MLVYKGYLNVSTNPSTLRAFRFSFLRPQRESGFAQRRKVKTKGAMGDDTL